MLSAFPSQPRAVSNYAYAPIRRTFSLLHILRTSMVGSPKGYSQSRVCVFSATQNDLLINLQTIPVATSLVHSSSCTRSLSQVSCLEE